MARESSFNASSAVQESKVEKLKRAFLPSTFDFSTFDVRRTAPVGLRRASIGVMNLFVYGTLRDEAFVRRLTGRAFAVEAAVLYGYRRFEPPGSYPYIVPDPTSEVHGHVLRDIDAAALRAFDAYEDEGRLYRRVEVPITVAARVEAAQVYVGLAVVRQT